MATWNGFGTRFMGFTTRDAHGCNFATEWAVAFYQPIVPLRRHYLRVGRSEMVMGSGTMSETTSYGIIATMRPKPREVLATYVFRWAALPAVALLPFWTLFPLLQWAGFGDGSGGGALSVLGVFIVLIWFVAGPTLLLHFNDRRSKGTLRSRPRRPGAAETTAVPAP